MLSRFYAFYDLPFDHDVCHLFEHIVIRSFLKKMQTRDYHRAFFGWLNGQTIDTNIFFDFSGNSPEIKDLFEQHIRTFTLPSNQLIRQSIGHIEAEMRAVIQIEDKAILTKQLKQLAHVISLQEDIPPLTTDTQASLSAVRATRQFTDIALVLIASNLSLDEQKAFLCFYPALLDIARDAAIDAVAAYPTGTSPLAIRPNALAIAQRFTIKKTVNLSILEKTTKQYIKKIDTDKLSAQIEQYVSSYIKNPARSTDPIKFFDETDIQTTREELAKIATKELLAHILNNTSVQFKPIDKELKTIDWQ